MDENGINRLLEKLGLTEYEAKTISSLFKLREAEAPEISRTAQVPKTRVYDVLDRLSKRNLIIEIQGRPKRYLIIDPEKVFSMLLEEKKQELEQLEKEADSAKEDMMEVHKGDGQERVMKVKDKKDFMKIMGKHIESAQKSVHGMTQMDKEHNMLKNSLRNAASKKVEIKLISTINSESGKIAKEFMREGAIIRDYEHGLNAYIIDDEKVVLGISDFTKKNRDYHFTIWPENRALASALKKYFEHAWEQGKEF